MSPKGADRKWTTEPKVPRDDPGVAPERGWRIALSVSSFGTLASEWAGAWGEVRLSPSYRQPEARGMGSSALWVGDDLC